MKKNHTHISVIIDKSGSTGSTANDTIGGFNTFLKEQQSVEGSGTLTLVQFDDKYEVNEEVTPLSDVVELNNETYCPRGTTALLDAMGRTINNTEAKLKALEDTEQPEKVIFLIITDGQENASTEFKKDHIAEMIKRHTEEDGWDFVFIGANMDAIAEGGDLGMRKGFSSNYAATSLGTKSLYRKASKGMTNYRSRSLEENEQIGFFDDIEDDVEADEKS